MLVVAVILYAFKFYQNLIKVTFDILIVNRCAYSCFIFH